MKIGENTNEILRDYNYEELLSREKKLSKELDRVSMSEPDKGAPEGEWDKYEIALKIAKEWLDISTAIYEAKKNLN